MKLTMKSKALIDLLIIVSLLIVCFLCFNVFINNKEEKYIEYKDSWEEDYSVHYGGNAYVSQYYKNQYQPSGASYIAKWIDYIDINFKYNLIFSEKLSGNTNYKVVARVLAKKNINDENNLLDTEFVLNDTVSEEFNKKEVINVLKDVKINYQDFVNYFDEYKKDIGLSLNGILRIELRTDVESNLLKTPLKKEQTIYVEIPLTSNTVEVTIPTSNGGDSDKVLIDTIYHKGFKYILSIVLFILSIFGIVYFAIMFIKHFIKHENSKSDYEKEIKKILTAYNNIIVNIDSIEDLNKYNVIMVNSFDELLDAHGEVRMPINYYEDTKESKFILINEGIAWVYILSKKKNERKKSKKK